jgi:hypothetical protein
VIEQRVDKGTGDWVVWLGVCESNHGCGHNIRKEVHGARIRWQPWESIPITLSRFGRRRSSVFLEFDTREIVKVILMVLMRSIRLR